MDGIHLITAIILGIATGLLLYYTILRKANTSYERCSSGDMLQKSIASNTIALRGLTQVVCEMDARVSALEAKCGACCVGGGAGTGCTKSVAMGEKSKCSVDADGRLYVDSAQFNESDTTEYEEEEESEEESEEEEEDEENEEEESEEEEDDDEECDGKGNKKESDFENTHKFQQFAMVNNLMTIPPQMLHTILGNQSMFMMNINPSNCIRTAHSTHPDVIDMLELEIGGDESEDNSPVVELGEEIAMDIEEEDENEDENDDSELDLGSEMDVVMETDADADADKPQPPQSHTKDAFLNVVMSTVFDTGHPVADEVIEIKHSFEHANATTTATSTENVNDDADDNDEDEQMEIEMDVDVDADMNEQDAEEAKKGENMSGSASAVPVAETSTTTGVSKPNYSLMSMKELRHCVSSLKTHSSKQLAKMKREELLAVLAHV